jgi:hypothetical protein
VLTVARKKCTKIVTAVGIASGVGGAAAVGAPTAAAVGRAAGAGIALSPSAKSKRSKLGKKLTQAEVIRRVAKAYPNGVGDKTIAEVRRRVSDKRFNPSWHSVRRALGRGK